MSHTAEPAAAVKATEVVTDRDIALGRRAITVTNVVYGAAFLVGIAAAVYVLMSIPLDTAPPDTSVSYKHAPWPAVVFIPMPLVIFGFLYFGSRFKTKPSPSRGPKARRRMYVKSVIFSVGFLWMYLVAAQGYLVAGGAWAG